MVFLSGGVCSNRCQPSGCLWSFSAMVCAVIVVSQAGACGSSERLKDAEACRELNENHDKLHISSTQWEHTRGLLPAVCIMLCVSVCMFCIPGICRFSSLIREEKKRLLIWQGYSVSCVSVYVLHIKWMSCLFLLFFSFLFLKNMEQRVTDITGIQRYNVSRVSVYVFFHARCMSFLLLSFCLFSRLLNKG